MLNIHPSGLLHSAGAAVRWVGRLAPASHAAERAVTVEMLPCRTRYDIALSAPNATCQAYRDAKLSEALGQGGHW
jgi:hypothetical protein